MSGLSTIEWTDATWNPVTGCTKVSPGCDHCYAERITERFHGKGSFERVVLHPERLDDPMRWRKPRMVFVNSMSDLFHVEVPADYLQRCFDVMAAARQHTFQILTKRAERLERIGNKRPYPLTLPNVWLGVSVESPAYYSRIRHLQRTPAALRFLSLEPLLAPLPDLPLDGIGWVIVGGESGPGARPMDPQWVRDIRDQCIRAGVPFFFKQWGAWVPGERWARVDTDGAFYRQGHLPRNVEVGEFVRPRSSGWTLTLPAYQPMRRMAKHAAGRELDGRTWDEMPATQQDTGEPA